MAALFVTCCIWNFLQTPSLPVKKTTSQKQAIHIINFMSFSAKCTSHTSKAKKLHIYPFMDDMAWIRSVHQRRNVLIRCERKSKAEKNVNALNLTRNSRLCSHHFSKEKISTDSYTSGDLVRFARNNKKGTDLQIPRRVCVLPPNESRSTVLS